ncbi:hemolysin D [Sinobacterium caligoides]|uniref:Membrane fusion protein (MFP) family protein n=1 Tax=Sinobacterium caligoides TaxID=933926 RepID=A0A3N2DZ13_9GAMM|nr:HlyD family type I secretion periplasmic adaptor subunit [Sinobacterium caligoides]ROS05078.1 hemolysin D [Sinobacterium caligoides]
MKAWHALVEAWRNRAELGDGAKTREIVAFQPAALEIQDSPPNPIPRWTGYILLALFAIGLLWACIGEVNIVASAEGKIIPSSRVKQIQPLEKGVVEQILVHEGEHVEAGQLLIELDSAQTTAEKQRLQGEYYQLNLQAAVSRSLLALLTQQKAEGEDTVPLTPDNLLLQVDETVLAADRSLFKRLLWQRWQQYHGEQQRLQSGLLQNESAQHAAEAEIDKLQRILPIVEKRASSMKGLHEKQYASEEEYLQLEQQRIQMSQDLVSQRYQLKQLEAERQQVGHQLSTLTAQAAAQELLKITELQQQLASLNEQLSKAVDLDAKQKLYAPVSGEVKELVVNTVGGVVTEAQVLMIIVPSDQQLEVEVMLENKDIGFVHEGMAAEIKIHTFPFTKYGLIDGEVKNVSDDATIDEQRGLLYGMHLLMDKNTIRVDGKDVELIPGMAVTAEVKIGQRRIIEFFLAPLLRHGQEGLRER